MPSDAQVEAGEKISTLTLVYKSATVLMNVDLAVDVKGIVLDDPAATADVAETLGGSTYGVVLIVVTLTLLRTIIGDVLQDLDGNDLCYHHLEGSKLYQGGSDVHDRHKKRESPSRRVVLLNSPRELVQYSSCCTDDATDDLAASPKLYITDTQNDAVEFKINNQAYENFSAGQEMDTIVFTFEAVRTAIKGGQVRFTLPRGWTAYEGTLCGCGA